MCRRLGLGVHLTFISGGAVVELNEPIIQTSSLKCRHFKNWSLQLDLRFKDSFKRAFSASTGLKLLPSSSSQDKAFFVENKVICS